MNFRLDRLLTLYLFKPLSRFAGVKSAILMYHSISDGCQNVHPYYQTLTSPCVFAEQMRFLHESGCRVIDLMTLVESLNAGKEPAPGSVVLTFDDGLCDFYTHAFPVLQEYGFPATVFLTTGPIDQCVCFMGCKCLSWDEVRELRKYGVSFGSHTESHPVLSQIAEKELLFEIVRSKERIEFETGDRVDAFSYPYAFPEHDCAHRKKLEAILSMSGYKCCVTTRIGTTRCEDDIFCLKRLPVNSMDDRLLLKAKIDGAYDWIYTLQSSYKRFRRGARNCR
ncbi:MAG TPA: polysaccharide deacetylase family protein [Syntrophobacteraceae bacterium]|nr:polysaccharide deacetylase family protein [Syntrophobacteraceae bacterium]